MNNADKIFIAGHQGMVGSAIFRLLKSKGYKNIITKPHGKLDLTRQSEVEEFFHMEKPDIVFLAAARVGGIMANATYKAEFFYQNSMISQNVIHASYKHNIKKLLNLGSSCIYPKSAPQPLQEDSLLTGPLEDTNDAYAIAKISAIKMCHYYNEQYGTDFLSVMPTNLYGEMDNYDPFSSHVLPGMIRKFHEAKIFGGKVLLWGDGSPLREFLYADDLADAVIYLMENKSASELGEFVNIGTGKDCSIKDLASMIAGVVGFTGEVEWDNSKPNGTHRKLLDVSRLRSLGWEAKIPLKRGIIKAYDWYLSNVAESKSLP